MGVLDGVKAKLDRADALIGELKARTNPIEEAAIASIRREQGASNSEVVFRLWDVPTIEADIAPMIGDVLHNVRSALDHLAWQLVLFDGGTPSEVTQFPISTKKGSVDIKPEIRSSAILNAVEMMQPFYEARYGHDPADDSLEVLRILNNYDKHRLLIATVCCISGDKPVSWGFNHGDPEPEWRISVGRLEPGDIVARFDFKGHRPPPTFDPSFGLVVSLAIAEAKWLTRRNIGDALGHLSWSVRHQINWTSGLLQLLDESPI